MSQLTQSVLKSKQLWKIVVSFSMAGIVGNVMPTPPAIAAETVILRHEKVAQEMEISFSELEAIAKGGPPSPMLKTFLAQAALTPEEMAKLLDGSIPDTGIPLGKTDIQFLLFELNKLVGDPFDRENLQPLAISLRSAYLDQDMSFLELLRRYPKKTVGLKVSRLNRVYQNVNLFVQRISPLFNFLEDLLPDLVCDCQLASDETGPDFAKLMRPKDASQQSLNGEQSLSASTNKAISHFQASVIPPELALIASSSFNPPLFPRPSNRVTQLKQDAIITSPSRHTTTMARVSQEIYNARKTPTVLRKVVMSFGPVRRSFTLEDLNHFAATGKVPQQWKSYLKLAKIKPQKFRALLTDQKPVDFLEIDKFLNSFLGEYALFQLGQLIQTPSNRANVQALRSSLVLSAANDEQISLLEILQNYPGQHLTIDAQKMLKFSKNLKGKGAVKLATANLEDVMVAVQSAIAKDLCNCIQPVSDEANRQDVLFGATHSDQLWAQPSCQKSRNASNKIDLIGLNPAVNYE